MEVPLPLVTTKRERAILPVKIDQQKTSSKTNLKETRQVQSLKGE
jgi:hypothetical protein